MDLLRGAAPLARLLLALGQSRRHLELELERADASVRVRLIDGRIAAISGVACAPLGDLLMTGGDLVAAREDGLHVLAAARIGARLIASGATSGRAVHRALSVQLLTKVESLLRRPPARMRFSTLPASGRAVSYSLDTIDGVFRALLRLAEDVPDTTLLELASEEPLTLTPLGERYLGALRGLAAEARDWRSLTADQLLAASPPTFMQPLRACLRVLGAVESVQAAHSAHDGYALLLRKHREVARGANASELLEIAATASPYEARRALRRLSKKLHPDRFAQVDERIRLLSEDAMRELTRAERAFARR